MFKLFSIGIIIFQMSFAHSVEIVSKTQNVLNAEAQAQLAINKAKEEVFSILMDSDLSRKEKRVIHKIEKFYQSMRNKTDRFSSLSDEKLLKKIERLNTKLEKSHSPGAQKMLENNQRMVEQIENGTFRENLNAMFSKEREKEVINLVLTKLDSEEVDIYKLTKLQETSKNGRAIAGIAEIGEFIWDYWSDPSVTGVPVVDILLGFVLFPLTFALAGLGFAILACGAALVGVFYCAPAFLVTGESKC